MLLSFVACELVVRATLRTDDDGQEWIGERRLRPYRLPLARIAERLSALESGRSFFVWDPDLGWSPRPGATSMNLAAHVAAGGVRGERVPALPPPADTLRIAVFGDSFTFGDEVRDDETWPAALEHALVARGVAAEVLNFGVNAYAMDQAYLRWQRDGRGYRPDVVLYGFQPENVLRNLNVFRALYFADTGMPLQKPRFVLEEGGLVTIGRPTRSPRGVLQALARLGDEPLVAHDRFAAPYLERWWLHSKLVALVATVLAGDLDDPFRLDDESRALARSLVAAFARDVGASGSAFVVVHLPRREDLATMRSGGEPWYAALLGELAAEQRVADLRVDMQQVPDDAAFAAAGHYSPALNRAVGEALAEPVLAAARARRRT